MLSPESRAWLTALHASVWKDVTRHYGPHPYPDAEVTRRLTPEEWGRVEAILRDEQPITSVLNSGWGFGCALAVHDDPEALVYPGVPVEPPAALLFVDKDHLPLEGRTRVVRLLGGKERVEPADRTFFDDGWAAFSPHTHSPENARRREDAGMPALQKKGYYEY